MERELYQPAFAHRGRLSAATISSTSGGRDRLNALAIRRICFRQLKAKRCG